MKTKITLSILIFLVSLNSFSQKWISVNSNFKAENKIELVKQTYNESILDVSINAYNLQTVQTPNGTEYIVNSKNAVTMQIKSSPNLPKLSKSLVIDNNKKMQVEFFDLQYTEIKNIKIAPSKGVITRDIDPSTVAYEYGNDYSLNQFFPKEIASISKPYIIRDLRGITVNLTPFQYNPVTKTLRIYTHYKVRVFNNGEIDNINVLTENKQIKTTPDDFLKIYNRKFLNFKNINSAKYTPLEEGTPGRMLIIAYGDFIDEMQNFVNWKNQKGILTEIVNVSSIGNSSAIKTYVQNYYANHSDFAYLLLVGDNAQVPSSSTSAGVSDNNYGYLAGSDHYLDIFVGRFSAETATQVTTQVDRTIHYEKDITSAENWMQYALCVASNEGGGSQGDDGESDITHETNISNDYMNYGYLGFATCYQGTGEDATDISTAINNHCGIATYTGHGDTQMWNSVEPNGYTNTHVDALTNTNKLPFVISVACVSGSFASNTCFGEAWQRSTDNTGNPTGAIANIASTINQSWNSPMCAQDEMVDILVESYSTNIKQTFGGITVNGYAQMIDEYGSDGENMADTWTCFGDASVLLRTKQPQNMVISHATGINVGSSTFNVNCDVQNALVSITKDNVIIGTQYVSGGAANVSLSPAITGTGSILVTVTAYNKVTYQQIVNIITSTNPPVCDFTGNPTTILEGQTVNFTDLSTEYPNTWNWEFEAGTPLTSNLQNPTITYSVAGTYNVKLKVQNSNGADSLTKLLYIIVNPNTNPPIADFVANNTNIIVGQTVNYTDLSVNNPTSWSWEFEGGTPSTSNLQNPTNVTYSTAGVYQVKLVSTNTHGFDEEIKIGYITVNPPVSCEAGASGEWEYINGVSCGTINNQSTGWSASGYGDYTAITTEILAGNTYSITVSIGNGYSSDQVYAWVDWNLDGDFTDVGENIFNSSQNGQSTYTFNFTVPNNASNGNIRLRIRLNDSAHGSVTESCGISEYGEVEDYTLVLYPITNVQNKEIKNNLVEIYPNPSNGMFNLISNKSITKISVLDFTGKVLFEINDSTKVELINRSKGCYFIKIQGTDFVEIKKVILN